MKKFCFLIILTVLFVLFGFSAASAIPPLTLRLDPATVDMCTVGETFDVQVMIDNVTDLGGFQFRIDYDTSIVTVADAGDVSFGPFLGSTGRTASALPATIDNSAGTIDYGAFSFGNPAGPNGTGLLATITFTVQSQASGTLDLTNSTVTDTAAAEIAVDSEGDTALDASACIPNPGVIQFSSSTYSADEGGTATITVNRTGGDTGAVSADYATSNGSASAGSDYTAASGTLNWANGESGSKTFNVVTASDCAMEGSEDVNLALSSPTGDVELGVPDVAVLTINDMSKAGCLKFSAASYSANEGDGSRTITVYRTGGSCGAVSVNYATSNGSASAGSDYSSTSGTLNWSDGDSSSKTFNVPIIDDNVIEGNETVNLAISSPGGGVTLCKPDTAVLTISDNDGAVPTLSEWGMIILTLLLGISSFYYMRRRQEV